MATLVLLSLSGAAPAADVPVHYTVNENALKQVAVSGTLLTFELHTDSNCSGAVHAETVPIDNLELIERVKRLTPKGGTKGPNIDRLDHVLSGAPAESTYFLKVTGTGVTPVGGMCQLQFSLPADTTGTVLPCASQVGNDVYFTGCNVNVRNGSGSTDGPTNGFGNVIIGYNAGTFGQGRTGSHNLVVGDEHTYTSFGGIVAGFGNRITGAWASVTGGIDNMATGYGASVTGGVTNIASGEGASVSGGTSNTAIDFTDSVSGGLQNTASGGYSSVSGGNDNVARGQTASLSGGFHGVASGVGASISGGNRNVASGLGASVSGGDSNTAGGGMGSTPTVSGGCTRTALNGCNWTAGSLFEPN